ncbi:MAG: hypothetical protein AAFQ77_03120 [Myxococcota bacterium]
MSAPSLPSRLPYWVTRTVDTQEGSVSIVVLKDGTIAMGARVQGVDIYTKPNSTLNQVTRGIRDALNALPSNAYLQTIYESGHSWRPLVRDYFNAFKVENPILAEARRRRAQMLASDEHLTRTRITFYLGLRHALGALLQHSNPAASKSLLTKLFGRSGKDAASIRASELHRAALELRSTAHQLFDTLASVGLIHRELNESELIDDIFTALNPASRRLFQPPTIIETRDDIERATYGQPTVFRGPNLSSQLCLSTLHNESRHIVLDDPAQYIRLLNLESYPLASDPIFLHPLQYQHLPETPLRLSITHTATEQQLSKEQMERKRTLLKNLAEGRSTDHGASHALAEFDALLETLVAHDTRIMHTSMLAHLRASSLAELDDATRLVRQGFAASSSAAAVLEDHQLRAFFGSLPAYGFHASRPYPIITENACHMVPYFQPAVGNDEPDMLFATRQRSLRKLSIRKGGSRDDANTFVIGATGSGKTFFFSHYLKLTLSLGGHVVIADIKGPENSSYKPIAELLGGQYIALNARDANVSFNPCPEHELVRDETGGWTEALEQLRDLICMMTVPDFDQTRDRDLYRRVALDVCERTYKATAESGQTPILSDVVDAFTGYVPETDRFKPLAIDMALRLRLWCEDRRRGALLNRPSRLGSNETFQVFDFFGIDDDPDLANVLVSTLATRLNNKLRQLPLPTPKLYNFDEAWKFIQHSELTSNLIDSLFRVARSYGAIIAVMSQDYTDVAKSAAASGMMANASVHVFLRANANHEKAAEVFNLDSFQTELYKGLRTIKGQYSEFLYIDRHTRESSVLRYAPTPYELWIDSSSPDDMALRRFVIEREGNVYKALDYLARTYPRGAPASALHEERQRAIPTAQGVSA